MSSMRLRRADAEPGVVPPEVDAVAVQADDELLALAHAEVLTSCREVGLGLRDESIALALDVVPRALREEIAERDDREALGVDVGDDPPLHVVQRHGVLGEESAALAVREHAVVES